MKGWYSVVQYCPDPSRAEAANVGLALLCPDVRFFSALMRNDNDRIRRFFGIGGDELDAINIAKTTMLHRIHEERFAVRSFDELVKFQKTRGNDLVLTDPRAVSVETPDETLRELFDELVGGRSVGQAIHRVRGYSARQALDRLFEKPAFEKLIREQVVVEIPTLGRPWRVPYAFMNGKLNLVTPLIVRKDPDETVSKAVQTILRADLLQRHNEAQVIAALPKTPAAAKSSTERLSSLLKEYKVRRVMEEEFEAFGKEVLAAAHS